MAVAGADAAAAVKGVSGPFASAAPVAASVSAVGAPAANNLVAVAHDDRFDWE